MVTICIYDSTDTQEEMEFLLEEILRLLKAGFTSGYYPHWELVREFNTDLPN